jgi:hypothetical protein
VCAGDAQERLVVPKNGKNSFVSLEVRVVAMGFNGVVRLPRGQDVSLLPAGTRVRISGVIAAKGFSLDPVVLAVEVLP